MSAIIQIQQDEFNLMRDLIEKECGIAIGPEKMYLVESRLTKLVMESGCENFGQFYTKVKSATDEALKNKIVDAMTTNETLWFRDDHPYLIFREVLLPLYEQQIQSGQKQKIRIWSAACSTGQEPYSLVMMVHEYNRLKTSPVLTKANLEFIATDISSSALMLAKLSRYDSIAMSRGMTDEFRSRYFEEQGRVFVLKPEVKEWVRFEQFNLQKPFLAMGKFDLILLRNVAIYFAYDFKVDLFKKLAGALNPGGHLILGASETLVGYSQDFAMREHGRGIYYEVK